MTTTLTKFNINNFSLRFVTSQYDSPTSVFSDSSSSDWPAIRMCIRTITGSDERKKLAVFLFYGALGSIHENPNLCAVLSLKGAHGTTGERITMHNIYNLESYAYGFACFLDMNLLESHEYIEDGQMTLVCNVRNESFYPVKMKKAHYFEINDPVLSDVVLHVDGKKFYANKKVLSSSSTLFSRILSKDNCIGMIFKDVKHNEFEQFLQCLYWRKNAILNNHVSMFILAKRYSALRLAQDCEQFKNVDGGAIKSVRKEASRKYSPPLPVFDSTKDNGNLAKSLDKVFEFDDATVVALLKRMQETIRFAAQHTNKYTFGAKDPVLTDAVLIVQEKKYYVNRKSLSDQSSVFRALFSPDNYNDDYGYGGNITEYELDNVKHYDIERFLKCFWSPQNIEKRNFHSVLNVSKHFEVHCMMDPCEKFLISCTDFDKSAKLRWAETYKLPNLQTAVLNSIKDSSELHWLKLDTSFSDDILKKLGEITI